MRGHRRGARGGADIVICGRVTDIALYLGPLIHEFGWAMDDWERLGAATAVAHAIECGGQATGGLYAGGWQDVPDLEGVGYPIAEVFEDGTAIITKTPGSGGEVSVGTVSEQMVYEIHDPANYLTADVTADVSQIRLEQVGTDRVRMTGATGKPRPETLKVNMGYRAGFIGEAEFTYTWPDAYAKAQRGLTFLKNRLERAGFEHEDDLVEYLGHNSSGVPSCRSRTTRNGSSSSCATRPAARTPRRRARSSPRASRSTTTGRPAWPASALGRRSRNSTDLVLVDPA